MLFYLKLIVLKNRKFHYIVAYYVYVCIFITIKYILNGFQTLLNRVQINVLLPTNKKCVLFITFFITLMSYVVLVTLILIVFINGTVSYSILNNSSYIHSIMYIFLI